MDTDQDFLYYLSKRTSMYNIVLMTPMYSFYKLKYMAPAKLRNVRCFLAINLVDLNMSNNKDFETYSPCKWIYYFLFKK